MLTRFRSLYVLFFLLLVLSPQAFAQDDEPEIGATFLNLHAGMKGQVALHWQGDPAAVAQVFIDFDGDSAWSSDELTLDRVPLSEKMTLHLIEVPPTAKIDFSTRSRLVVYGAERQILLDVERPLFQPRELETASATSSACQWRPGFAEAQPTLPLSAMAIHDDGGGAALFVAMAESYTDPESGNTTITSYLRKWTGSAWSTLGPAISGPVHVLLSRGSQLYAGGEFSVAGASYLARWDGSTQSWQNVGGTANGPVYTLAEFQGNLYIGGAFTQIGAMTANRIARWNGAQWEGLRNGANSWVLSLEVWNSNLYAGGYFTQVDGITAHYIAKYNGSSWSKVAENNANGLAQVVYDLESFGTGANSALYAGGAFGLRSGTSIAKWDGSAWSSPGVVNGPIQTLEPFTDTAGNSALYVGGQFTSAGGITTNNLARFTGSVWQSLGNSADGQVLRLIASTDTVPVLWTMGHCNVAPDGTSARYLARYDGTGFLALGQGMNDDVNTLLVDEPNLLAGGKFTAAGGLATNRIAKWDGKRWWNFGSGTNWEVKDLEKWDDGSGPTFFAATSGGVLKWNGTIWSVIALGDVRSLTIWDGKLYASASSQIFSGLIPLSRGYLASWNGSAWQAVIGAPQAPIYAAAVGPDNHLYVGGDFGTAGGTPAANLARYDGSAWSNVGAGLNSDVYALAVHRGQLYAGGDFTATADGSTVLAKLAKWTGTRWEAVGGGTNSPVWTLGSYELEVGKPRLIVGGYFTRAGGLVMNRLAAFDDITGTWEAFGQGLDGPVFSLAQIEGPERILYVGGDFLNAGGSPSHYIARWVCPGEGAIDVSVNKSSSSPAVNAGALHRYTVTVRSEGLSTANGVVFEDIFDPTKLASCTWTATGTGSQPPSGFSSGAGASIRQTLTLPPGSAVTYEVQCRILPSARGTVSNTARAQAPGDGNPANDTSTVTDTIIPPPTGRGDCDGNTFVELADRLAIHLEIFDGDGHDPDQAPGGSYPGHPIGCNANGELRIDAGDLACLDRLLSNQVCSTVNPSSQVPVLSLPGNLVVANGQVLVPVALDPADHDLHALSFSITYDGERLVPAGNLATTIEKPGLSPGGSLLVQHVAAERRIDISLIQPSGVPFPAGALIRIPMTVVNPSTSLGQAVAPSQNNVFAGDQEGRSIPGQFILVQEVLETLILTHTGRLSGTPGLGFEDPAKRSDLLGRLQQLAEHPRVRGLVVDLADYPGLNALYTTWVPGSPDPGIANQVLIGNGGLIDLVANLLEAFPSIKYLLIVGDDRIIPMARLKDQTQLSEQRYTGNDPLAQIGTGSSIGKSLAAGYFLSDDPLASGNKGAAIGVIESPWRALLPRLAPGRLVENADEIFTSIDLFFEVDGVADLRSLALSQRQALVSGYDVVTDGAREVARRWRSALGTTSPDTYITPVDYRLIGHNWNAQHLLAALRNTDDTDGIGPGKSKILSINGHANHWQIGVPTASTGLATSAIYGATCATTQGSSLDLEGAVILGMSCHAGLAIPGSCQNDPDHSLDLPQVMLASGALVYGDNAGFAWANWNGWGLGERFAADLSREILAGESIGDAVRAAKRSYHRESFRYDPYDHKTLLQWTLYGFPMAFVDRQLNTSTLSEEPAGPQFGAVDADGFQRGTVGKVVVARRLSEESPELAFSLPDYLTRAEVRLDFTADGVYTKYNRASDQISTSATCPTAGCYYRLNLLATDESDLPIQPFFVYESNLSNTVPRESLWMGGVYRTEETWHPLFSGLQSSSEVIDPRTLPMQYYVRPRGGGSTPLPDGPETGCLEPTFGYGASAGRFGILTGELIPASVNPLTWHERIFEKLDIETFYFGATPLDCRAPLLNAASDTSFSSAGRLHWRITTTDDPLGVHSSGVWRVVVVWDDENWQDEAGNWDGRYVPVELELIDGVWQGSIDASGHASIRYYVQAVDREGNVAWLNQELAIPPSGIDPEVAAIRSVEIEQIDADLHLVMSPAVSKVNAGQTVTIEGRVENHGPTASPAHLSFTLPAGFTRLFAGGDGWTCTGSTVVSCDLTDLQIGLAPPIFLVLQGPAIGNPAPFTVVGEIGGDSHPEGNGAEATIQVLDSSLTDLRVSGSLAVSGNVATFTVDIYNEDNPVTGALLTMTFPATLSNITWTCSGPAGSSCQGGSQAGGTVSTSFSMPVGGPLHYEGTATFNPGSGSTGPVRIRAEISPPPGMTDYKFTNNWVEMMSEAWIFADGFESGDLSAWNR